MADGLDTTQEDKAAAVLAKFHANSEDKSDPLVVFELAQIRHAIRLEEEINRSTSYKSLFATPGNRKRMRLIVAIALFSQWSGNGLVSYYMNLILEGMLFTFAAWTVSNALYINYGNTAAAKATIPLIFIFYLFYDIAYTPMVVAYTLEILPYRIRAKGFAIMNLTIMLTVAFNQFINPVAIDAIGWWYYLVYCGWLVIELAFVVAFVVETKGRTLEETSVLFDGVQSFHDLLAMGGEAATMTMESRGLIEVKRNTSQVHVQIEKKIETYEMQQQSSFDRELTDIATMPRAL
ncbi:hypothetical protein C0993_003772 [Termitomyces sp. T159_Od127]|nr:hypothetical protein C0993_003772 [Termitomyces sp. T159_Od127]